MSDYQESDQKVSKYNSAVSQIYRLDALWQNCNKTCVLGNFLLWNSYLDRIWAELSADLEEDKYKKEVEEFNGFSDKLSQVGILREALKEGFALEEVDLNQKAKIYLIILSKEIWLRRLQNRLGKGSAYEDEFEDDFD